MKENLKIHLVLHFHYDVVYRRSFEEYLRISFDNLIEMLNISEKHHEYTFLIEQVILLEEFWNVYPEFRNKLRKLAKDGRLEIGCGMYVMPDMSYPNGESLIQNAYWGKKWIKENLGLDVKVCWIADCWNHHRQIPQIMKIAGYDYYAFSRSMRLDINPVTEFYWEGIDGTKILTHWMSRGYDGFAFSKENELAYVKKLQKYFQKKDKKELEKLLVPKLRDMDIFYMFKGNLNEIRDLILLQQDTDIIDLKTLERVLDKLQERASTNVILLPCGRDFMKPQQIAPVIVKKWNEKNPDKKIYFSRSVDFFKDVEMRKKKLPVYDADFAPTFQGTHSSHIEIKQWNRKLENKINTAEKLNAIILGTDDSRKELDNIWKKILLNQFHDIICGSINDISFREVIVRYLEADNLLDRIILKKIDVIGKQILIKEKDELYLLVFNPSSHNRIDLIEAEISITEDDIKGFRVFYGEDEVVSQITNFVYELRCGKKHLIKATLLFVSEISSLGYKVFKIVKLEDNIKYPNEFIISGDKIENNFYKITISKSGTISSLIMKETNEEFVNQEKPFFNNLVHQQDEGDFWVYYKAPVDGGLRTTMWFYDPMSEQGEKVFYSHYSKNKLEIIEKGPIRVTIKVTGKLKDCKFTQYTYIYSNIKRIDFKTLVLPKGKYYRLRVCFPTNIKGKIRYEIPFGIQERGEGEYIAQSWIDYFDNKKGICLLNEGIPGNNVTDKVMMLALFRATNYRGAGLSSSEGFCIGVPHTFKYSIVPFNKLDNTYKPYHYGEDFNSQLISRIIEVGKGKLPIEHSFINVKPSNVVISSITARDKKLLIRVYEAEGKKINAELKVKRTKFRFLLNKFQIKEISKKTVS